MFNVHTAAAKTVARHKYYFQFYFCSNNVWVVCCWENFSLSARNSPQIVNPVKYFHWNSSAKSILQFITFSNYLDGGGQEGHWEAGCWQGRKGKWSSIGLFYTDYNFRSHIPSSSSSWSTKSNRYCQLLFYLSFSTLSDFINDVLPVLRFYEGLKIKYYHPNKSLCKMIMANIYLTLQWKETIDCFKCVYQISRKYEEATVHIFGNSH